MVFNTITEAEQEIYDIAEVVDQVSSLVFVTWDSFENGAFMPEHESYSPVLRNLLEQMRALKERYEAMAKAVTELHERIKSSEKEGVAE